MALGQGRVKTHGKLPWWHIAIYTVSGAIGWMFTHLIMGNGWGFLFVMGVLAAVTVGGQIWLWVRPKAVGRGASAGTTRAIKMPGKLPRRVIAIYAVSGIAGGAATETFMGNGWVFLIMMSILTMVTVGGQIWLWVRPRP